MNYLKKIDAMFDLLLDENTYSKFGINQQAKYWKIGTSIFNTFDRFLEKINYLDISKPVVSEYNDKNLTTEGSNKTYKLFIGDVEVTPCKVRGYVSNAAIHQYMRMLCAFGLGCLEKKYKNLKDFVINNGQIKLVHNIKTLINIKVIEFFWLKK